MNDNSLMGVSSIGSGSYNTFVAEVMRGNTDIPQEIRKSLQEGKAGYKVRPFSGYKAIILGVATSVEVFKSDDVKKVGICNIDKRRPQTGELIMIDAIQVLSAEALGITDADLQNILFKAIEEIATHDVLINGDCKLAIGGQTIFDELPNQAFNTKGDTNLPQGFYPLHKPLFVNDAQPIEFTFRAAATTGLTANSAIKVFLHGVKVSFN